MRIWLCFAIVSLFLPTAFAVVRKKPAKPAAQKKVTVLKKKPGAHKVTVASRKSSSRHRAVTTAKVSQPARQMAPSNDRYREIQEALATKGYLATPPNGQWDQNSQDAMRRFQADQKLSSNGKLTSRSIIALGLGSQSADPNAAQPPKP